MIRRFHNLEQLDLDLIEEGQRHGHVFGLQEIPVDINR